MPEPLFATFKIEAGDYILPANDQRHLWRIKKGHTIEIREDSSEVEVPAWEIFKWVRTIHDDGSDGDRVANDIFDWDMWEFEGSAATKREAIDCTAEMIEGPKD